MEEKKEFVWYGVRIGFWVMISIWFIEIGLSSPTMGYIDSLVLTLFWIAVTIFTFVVSIIHLIKYKRKAFAITALSVSAFALLQFIIGFVWGVAQAVISP